MKILYNHRTRGKGVEGVHIRSIVNALRKLGNEVYVISPPGVDPMNPIAKIRRKSIINRIWDWISARMPQIGFEILELSYNLFGYWRIRKAFEDHPIDAIYERYAFFGWIGTYMAKKKDVPIILEVNEVSGIKRVRKQTLVRLAKAIERKIFESADGIIVVSNFLKRHIVEKMNIDAEKIYVIPNAVDPEIFDPIYDVEAVKAELGLRDKVVIGFVGSFVAWNKLDFLLEAFTEISEAAPDAHLLLVGDGPIRESLEKRINEEKIKDKVTITGSVDHAEVPRFIAAMDICVLPHSNEYRSPVKIFEYMSMVKPVVAPRLEPIEAIIEDGENGILFDQDDRNSLKECMIRLIRDKGERDRIASQARKTVLQNHTWRENAKAIMRIYGTIIAKAPDRLG
ncbi:MAG: hypothetical protein DRP09_13335 [Candidatus Thorarchaeota archaeon]|nr:MAG: hypothetical protein DRP09_13335 [Candidatus Thorarchaeota archaeon]